MRFIIEKAVPVLERTPVVLRALLSDLADEWITGNEGPDTFSPFDIVGHLIHGEKTDWPDRARMILEKGTSTNFVPYDRFAMYDASKGKSIDQLLDEFEECRRKSIDWLLSVKLTERDLDKKGSHPVLGEVTMRQLLSAWVVHDLTHIAQAGRVMAKQYKKEIGPWVEFFRILNF